MTTSSICTLLAAASLSGTSLAAMTFDASGQSALSLTGWTSAAGLSQSTLPVGLGVTPSPAHVNPGGPGITEGTGVSFNNDSNWIIHPAGLRMGDAGTGVAARAYAEGQCSPVGFAFNSSLGTGTLTVANTTAAAWTLNWVLDYSWLASVTGTLPGQEGGNARGEASLFADGNELATRGQTLTYPAGGSASDNNSVYGSTVIPANSQVVLYARAYAVGTVNSTPTPGTSAALLAGIATALRRRRPHVRHVPQAS